MGIKGVADDPAVGVGDRGGSICKSGIRDGCVCHEISPGITVFVPDQHAVRAGKRVKIVRQPVVSIIAEILVDIVCAGTGVLFEETDGVPLGIIGDVKSIRVSRVAAAGDPGDAAEGVVGIGMIVEVVDKFPAGGKGEQHDEGQHDRKGIKDFFHNQGLVCEEYEMPGQG